MTPKDPSQDLTIEVVQLSPTVIKAIRDIELASFPLEWQFPNLDSYLSGLLSSSENICICASIAQQVVGHLIAIPISRAKVDLRGDDPKFFEHPEDGYYVETIAVEPKSRRRGIGAALLLNLDAEVKRRECGIVAMHARIANGLSRLATRLFRDRIIRQYRIENWEWIGGEPTEFIAWEGNWREVVSSKAMC